MVLSNSNLSGVQKICLAGLLTALATACQKVFAINYIPIVPFLRISFGGPATIIFASIFLGPFYGLAVGAFSDILGYLVFDPKNMGFFPQITLIYALLGFLPFFVYQLFKSRKNNIYMTIAKYVVVSLSFLAVTLFLLLKNEIRLYGSVYQLDLITKIVCICLMAVLTLITEIFVIIVKRNNRLKNLELNIDSLNITLIIVELVIMVGFGTVMKGFAFGFETYPAILLCQILVLFVNIPMNLFLVSLFLSITQKYRA